ncbi:MAG TPA: rhomboid family intramembrane serine protease [Candidatus Saccharimonadales bacterium]|nr:rhomboid family intramembrane serine protease [Candidatus Saccharimonadales bacterium]
MANCLKCGTPLPAFSFGDNSPLCNDCRAQTETELTRQETAPRRPRLWDDLPPAADSGPAWLTATHFLVAINVAVFAVMVGTGVSFMLPSSEHLTRWGSDNGPLTLGGQYWRSVTSAFVHIGIIHLALNMWCLLALAQPLERLLGKLTTVLVYIVTAVGASLLSLWWSPIRNGAGASGAIFGIAGVLISFFYFAKLDLPKTRVKGILGWVVRFAVMNLIIGLAWRINNMAHLGGLLTGLVLGFFFAHSYSAPMEERRTRQVIAAAGLSVALAAMFPLLVKAKALDLEIYEGEVLQQSADYTAAIPHFQKAVALRPKDPQIHGALGYALAGAHRYSEAMTEYQYALTLQPDFPWVQVNMAATLLGQGHPDQAVALFKKMAGKITWESEDFRYFGEALRMTGSLTEAETALKKAIELDPKDARPHQQLAIVYRQMGRNGDADTEAKSALSLDRQKK